MIPKEVIRGVGEYFAELQSLNFRITNISRVGGGDINEAAIFDSTEGPFFVKWNNSNRYPGMFKAEALGLEILLNSNEIDVAKPLYHDEINGIGFLLLEAIVPVQKEQDFWFKFGNRLAELHKHTKEWFGLESDNYIGSLRQFNKPKSDWIEFFVTQRIEYQLKILVEAGKVPTNEIRKFDKLFSALERLIPRERPALIHGDLWSGNFMTDSSGRAILIDPAIYYAHREMDIAMTQLFGGFEPSFYSGYQQNYPLESGWQERCEICNIYPLLVHANLFGSGYYAKVERIIKTFI